MKGTSGAGKYGDFVALVDKMVGRVMEALDRNQIAQNTLFIMTSDNGAEWDPSHIEEFGHRANHLNLRGKKRDQRLVELMNMIEMAEVLAVSAAHRKESRGAHTCRDFPTRDDENYLYHTMCHNDPDGPRLGKKDVKLGHWVPEERKY